MKDAFLFIGFISGVTFFPGYGVGENSSTQKEVKQIGEKPKEDEHLF